MAIRTVGNCGAIPCCAPMTACQKKAKPASGADQTALLRQLPSVDELLLRPRVADLGRKLERGFLVEMVRGVLAQLRRDIVSGEPQEEANLAVEAMELRIVRSVEQVLAPSLRGVINASGVILHTNLGRAPLPAAILGELQQTATQYSNLEYDVAAGARGKRDVHTSRLIEQLTGAEAAIVVNNCAAAVLVTLAALARGGEGDCFARRVDRNWRRFSHSGNHGAEWGGAS